MHINRKKSRKQYQQQGIMKEKSVDRKKKLPVKKKICEPTTIRRTPTQCIISSPTLQKKSHENDSNEISRRDLKYPSPYMHLYQHRADGDVTISI